MNNIYNIVGLALIGGLLAWLNRRGGCTARNKQKRPTDFEDFGLAETDFPHHRSPPMAAANVAAGAAAGGAAAAAAAGKTTQSPTVPRLNDQGNFYNDSGRHYYEPQLNHPQEYGAGAMSPPQHQQQQGYYYQDQGQGGGYYDEQGYYYDGSTAVSSQPMYDPNAAAVVGGQAPMQQQQHGDYYKPDTADGKPHLRS